VVIGYLVRFYYTRKRLKQQDDIACGKYSLIDICFKKHYKLDRIKKDYSFIVL
jgi:hypothetical protein